MLKHRLLMSALLIPGTIGLFVWDHHLGQRAPVLLVLVLLVSVRCVWELVALVRTIGLQPDFPLCWISSWMLIAIAWLPAIEIPESPFRSIDSDLGGRFVLLGFLFVLFAINAIRRFSRTSATGTPISEKANQPGTHTKTLGVELLIVTYVGVLLAITVQLRWTANVEGSKTGYLALAALVVATKMGDVGAYTFGRLIGGPKMTPKLSPGKTWSGGVGHVVTAGLSSVAWLSWLGPKISWSWGAWSLGSAICFGVVVGLAGLFGDLVESLIKRDVGVKDAPVLLPGFGGLLDLMDSLLLAGPVAYGMWHLLR